MPSITVAVVEDDPHLRKTFERVIGAAAGLRVLGTVPTVREAVERIPSLAPDVLLVDVNLPDGNGIDCIAALSPRLPETQILVITVYQDPETTFRAIMAGAHGYLVKPVKPKRLVEAIREVRGGGVPMSPAIARKVLEAFRVLGERRTDTANRAAEDLRGEEPGMPPREAQVLELLVKGYSYKEIAAQLEISVGTVSTYVNRIYKRLHVSSRREIMAWSRGK